MIERKRDTGPTEVGGVYPTNLIPLDDNATIRAKFEPGRYKKLESIVRLRSAGLPTLPGFIITELNDEILAFLSGWALALDSGSKRLSLRFDSVNPEDNKKLSMANPSLGELAQMRHLVKPPIIGLVLAENDRFNQGYSVLTQFGDEFLRLEIVGPGFDAADLTRGQVAPHEVYELRRRRPENYDLQISAYDLQGHHLIDNDDYVLCRRIRYGVIYSVLERGLGKDVLARKLTEEETARVDGFLKKRGAQIPLEYRPLGYDKLQQVYRYVSELDSLRDCYRKTLGIDVQNRVLAASFLNRHGLVFWDLYGAEKYGRR